MDESQIPAWIKKIQHERALDAARKDASRKQVVEHNQRLRDDGPKFWEQLQKSLAVAVASLPVLNLSGSISHFKEGIRVEVVYQHLIPVQTYTDISYDPVKAVIRCSTMSGGICQLYLGVADNNDIIAVSELDGPSMNPEQACEFIVRPMVDLVFI